MVYANHNQGRLCSASQALAAPVQTAGFPHLNEVAKLRRLQRMRITAVHPQGLVAAAAVIVGTVIFEDPPQMRQSQDLEVQGGS